MPKDKAINMASAEAPSTFAQYADGKERAGRSHQLLSMAALRLNMTGEPNGEFDESRAFVIEESSKKLFIAVWRSIQNGSIDERSRIADAALELRDALNPDWPHNPGWLPEELQAEQ